jgi:hypothetical protein
MEQAGANVPGETLKISVGFYGKLHKGKKHENSNQITFLLFCFTSFETV